MPRIKKPSGLKRVDRSVKTRKIKQHYLIVCEGAKTEPNYFEKFPQPIDNVGSITVRGIGANTDSLVERTVILKSQIERERRQKFSRVWCVFDRDSFPKQNFNRALELAKLNGFCVACTNNAFEMWYLMHFDYHDAAISREHYAEKLSTDSRLSFPYAKNRSDMYAVLLPKQADAIRNAKNLYATYGKRPNLEDSDPITLVHKLVEELNALAKSTGQYNPPKCP